MMRAHGGVHAYDVEKGEYTNVARDEREIKESSSSEPESWRDTAIAFAFCFIGLQASYLTWGVMQVFISNIYSSNPYLSVHISCEVNELRKW